MKFTGMEISAVAVIVTVLVILLLPAMQSDHIHPDRAWKQQVTAIKAGDSASIVFPDLNLAPSRLDDLGQVSGKVTELNVAGEELASRIDRIAACSHLKILHLRTQLGDPEVVKLAQLRELEVLDLPLALNLTDAGLAALTDHPNLKLIRLRAPRVTDEGLRTLERLPSLKWVHLMEVPVTDKGLAVFRDLKRLESLYLDGDQATEDGLSQLIQARPDLHFHRDQLHLNSDPRSRDGHQDSP